MIRVLFVCHDMIIRGPGAYYGIVYIWRIKKMRSDQYSTIDLIVKCVFKDFVRRRNIFKSYFKILLTLA